MVGAAAVCGRSSCVLRPLLGQQSAPLLRARHEKQPVLLRWCSRKRKKKATIISTALWIVRLVWGFCEQTLATSHPVRNRAPFEVRDSEHLASSSVGREVHQKQVAVIALPARRLGCERGQVHHLYRSRDGIIGDASANMCTISRRHSRRNIHVYAMPNQSSNKTATQATALRISEISATLAKLSFVFSFLPHSKIYLGSLP